MNTSEKTPQKSRERTQGVSPSLLQVLGLFLAMVGFLVAVIGFISIVNGKGTIGYSVSGSIGIVVIGGLMIIIGVVLGRRENRPK